MTFSSLVGGIGGGGGVGGGGLSDTIGRGLIRLGADVSSLKGDVRRGMQDVQSETAKGMQGMQQQSSRFWGGVGTALKVGAFATAGAAAAAIGIATNAAIQYESAFAGVVKTVDASPAVLARLRDRFRELSKEIPISANEFARLGEAAGALGVKTENIEEFARITALIGVTTDVSADQAAVSLGQLSNVLDLTSDDYERFGSTLVDLGNKGASTESQILEIASRSGAMGKQVGLTTPTILAFASAVANLGIEVEAGGSSLQYLYSSLSAIMADEAKLTTLGEAVGTTGEQFRQAFEEDAQGAIISFLRALGSLDATGQAVLLDELGLAGVRTSRAYIGLAESLDKNLLPALGYANDAWDENNALQIEADKRFGTTASQLQLLSNIIGDLFIELGDMVLPVLREVVEWLADAIPAAMGTLADAWNSTLGPAVGAMVDGFGRIVEAVTGLFNFDPQAGGLFGTIGALAEEFLGLGDDATEAGSVMERAFDGTISVLSIIAEWVGKIADTVANILESDIGGWVAQTLIVLGGARLIVDGLVRGTRFLSNLGPRTLNWMTFGALGGQRGAGAAAADAFGGADNELTLAARELLKAATGLQTAASALRGAATVDAATPPVGGAPVAGAGTTAARTGGTAAAAGTTAGAAATRSFVGGLVAGSRNFLGGLRAGAGAVFSLASRAFWPALVAGLVLDIAKQPVADIVTNVLGKERWGQEIARDGIIAGIGTWLEATLNGLDVEEIAGMSPEIVTASGVKMTRVDVARMNFSDATLDVLRTDEAELSLEGQMIRVEAVHASLEGTMGGVLDIEVPELVIPPITGTDIGDIWTPERADQIIETEEARVKWIGQVRELADRLGMDLEGIFRAAMAEAGTTDIYNPETLAVIERILRDGIRGARDKDREELRTAVTGALKQAFPEADEEAFAMLTGQDIEFLAAALSRNADGSFTTAIEQVLAEAAAKLTGKDWEFEVPEAGDIDIIPTREGPAQVSGAANLNERIEAMRRQVEGAINWEEMLADPAQRGEQAIVDHANDMLSKYGAAIVAAAKDETKQQAIIDALGVGTWEEVLAEQQNWLDQNGSTMATNLATGYADILTAAGAEGVDLSKEPWALEAKRLLQGMLDDGTLPDDVAADIQALLNTAFRGARGEGERDAADLGENLAEAGAGALRNKHPEFRNAWNEASKPPATPLKGPLDEFSSKVVGGVARPIRASTEIGRAIATAAGKVPPLDAERFRQMGRNIIQWIADGAAWSSDLVRNTVAGAMSNMPVPQSPVTWGPLKHPFLPNAGRKIIEQIAGGVDAASGALQESFARAVEMPTLPTMNAAAVLDRIDLPSQARAPEMLGKGIGSGEGASQSVHIDRAYFNNAQDEKSLLARTRFLMPRTN